MSSGPFTIAWDRKSEAWFLIDSEGYYLDAWGVFRRMYDIDVYSPRHFEELDDAFPVLCDLSDGPVRRYRILFPSGVYDEVTL